MCKCFLKLTTNSSHQFSWLLKKLQTGEGQRKGCRHVKQVTFYSLVITSGKTQYLSDFLYVKEDTEKSKFLFLGEDQKVFYRP